MGPQSAADGTALANLADAVRDYTGLLRTIDSAGLERPWAWGPYDGEGVRFSVFRTFEELRELAVALAAARVAAGRPSTEASLFLAGHHLAQRDLWAMLGSPPEVALDQVPAPGSWPLRKVLHHLIGADLGFLVVELDAREWLGQGGAPEAQPGLSDADWARLAGLDDAAFDRQLAASLPEIRAYHEALHVRIVASLHALTSADLDRRTRFWDGLQARRFRLGRFESHLRQHAIQAEMALLAVVGPPTESDRLARLVAGAQAEVEAVMLDGPDVVEAGALLALAKTIRARTAEIGASLGVSA